MSLDRPGRRATRIAKAALDLVWWAGIGLGGITVLLFLLSPLVVRDAGFQLGVDVPVQAIAEAASGPLALTTADTMWAAQPVLQVETRTRLEFHTRRWWFFALAHAPFVPLFVMVLAAVRMLRAVLADALAGSVFTRRNARRLSVLGWLVILLGVAAPAHEWLRGRLILANAGVGGAALEPAVSEANGLWFVGLLLLVLAAVWRYGAELQDERDLTV